MARQGLVLHIHLLGRMRRWNHSRLLKEEQHRVAKPYNNNQNLQMRMNTRIHLLTSLLMRTRKMSQRWSGVQSRGNQPRVHQRMKREMLGNFECLVRRLQKQQAPFNLAKKKEAYVQFNNWEVTDLRHQIASLERLKQKQKYINKMQKETKKLKILDPMKKTLTALKMAKIMNNSIH